MTKKTEILLALLRLEVTLNRIESFLVSQRKEEFKQMAVLDDQIQALQTKVAANTDATNSAKVLIAGIPQMILDAATKAQAAGATPTQLQAFTDLGAALQSNTDGLAAAVVAGTPAASV
jgi:hypothetical protein